MTEETDETNGQPPAIVLYAVYATLFAVLLAVLILVGVYA